MELPTKIKDVRNHIYYILTHGNLYAMSKEDREIRQVFYKGERIRYNRPRLLHMNVLIIGSQYALGLVLEGGALLIVDPMSLQAFQAF